MVYGCLWYVNNYSYWGESKPTFTSQGGSHWGNPRVLSDPSLWAPWLCHWGSSQWNDGWSSHTSNHKPDELFYRWIISDSSDARIPHVAEESIDFSKMCFPYDLQRLTTSTDFAKPGNNYWTSRFSRFSASLQLCITKPSWGATKRNKDNFCRRMFTK
jgi:hypothetical protein